jgi:hypothetical protein
MVDACGGAQAVRLALGHPARDMNVFVIASPDTVLAARNAAAQRAHRPAEGVR